MVGRMKLFDYIFYRIAAFYKKRKDLTPENAAALIVSVLQFFLIFDLFILVRIFHEYSIPPGFNKFWALPLIITLGIINWYRFEKNSRFKDLREIWKDEDEFQKRKRGILIVSTLVALLLIPVIYGLVRQNIMSGKSFFS